MSRPTQQEIEDMRNAARLERAYMAANRTPVNPAPSDMDKAQEMVNQMPASSSAGAGRGMVNPTGMKRGGSVKKMSAGGSASKRADGIAQRGKTRGTFVACGGGMMK